MKFTPIAWTSISSSPGAGVGAGTSSSTSTSAPPDVLTRIAFIQDPPPLDVDARDVSPQHALRDRLELHVRRTFVDRADLRVPIELLGRIILRVAVAPEQL